MKKILASAALILAPLDVAYANENDTLGWNFSQSGLAGLYYGISQTRDLNNVDTMPNRLVFRADGKLGGGYNFESGTNLTLQANYTIVSRQHDKSYHHGDWRFYPYGVLENKSYGKLTIGHTYNASYYLHLGAQDITWVGIQDSNLSYWLTSANWSNGFKAVKFATPKSTRIMDDGRSFKFSYFTPEIGNTKFGISYAPDNASRRGMVSRYAHYDKQEDGYTFAMQNRWTPGIGELYTSVGYGLFNRTDNEWAFGIRWQIDKFNISASYKNAYIAGKDNPISTTRQNEHLPAYFDNYREGEAWDLSFGYDFGRFSTNLAYLHTEAQNTRHSDNLILQSNRFALNDYLDVFLINGYLNSKGLTRASDNNSKGYAVITGIAIKY